MMQSMQSIALAESSLNNDFIAVDDFVVVQHAPSSHHVNVIEDHEDDESYDYCDDIELVIACDIIVDVAESPIGRTVEVPASTSIVQHATIEEQTMDIEGEDFILSVPSCLLKDLDEAHRAAKMVVMNDEEDADADADNEQRDTRDNDDDHDDDASAEFDMPNLIVDSDDTIGDDDDHQRNDTMLVVQSTKTSREVSTSTATEQNSAVVSMSRTSNKKRRKKMKLMKRAAALASMASTAHAGNDGLPAGSTASSAEDSTGIGKSPCLPAASYRHKESRKKCTSSKQSKKQTATAVAANNIAVICATKSLAAFKDEIRSKQTTSTKQCPSLKTS